MNSDLPIIIREIDLGGDGRVLLGTFEVRIHRNNDLFARSQAKPAIYNRRIMQDKSMVSLFAADGRIKKRVLTIVLRTA